MDIPGYIKIYNMGHRQLWNLGTGPIIISEKIDGSFGAIMLTTNGIKYRSKNLQINVEDPPNMFKNMITATSGLALQVNWIYYGEVLQKPKHNALTYERIPENGIILFDILSEKGFLSPREVELEGQRLGLEVVPTYWQGAMPTSLDGFLTRTSVLGGPIEGIVIKNFNITGRDGNFLAGKLVREEYREVHRKEWHTESNTSHKDTIERLATQLCTLPRLLKVIEHLRAEDKITDSVQDIGLLMVEVPKDILEEEIDYIKEHLYKVLLKELNSALRRNIPEMYKKKLAEIDPISVTLKEGLEWLDKEEN